MFSVAEKRKLAGLIEAALLAFAHPEMPSERPSFTLHVEGKNDWSWADIGPNWQHDPTNPNPWNEVAREVLQDS